MSSLTVSCPQCGKSLRLRDRSLLGRQVKCPRCKQSVVLTAARPTADETVTKRQAAESSATSTADVIPSFEAIDAGIGRLRDIKRKNRRRRNVGLFVGAIVVGGFAAFLLLFREQIIPAGQPAVNDPPVAATADKRLSDTEPKQALDAIAESPTKGEPIRLTMIPAGARIVIHLRPAELWQPESSGEECLNCLGPLRAWAETKLRELSGFEPGELEELLISLIPGPRGTPPDVAAVLRLVEVRKRSDLLLKFGGQRSDEYDVPVYIDNERVYLIDDDLRTMAVAPAKFAGEIAGSVKFPNPTSPGVEALMPDTDRQRHVTLIFDPVDVRLHADVLFSEAPRDVVNALLDWLGEDAETVVWSAHLSDEFFSEVLLRNSDSREQRQFLPKDLLEQMEDRIAKMPRQVLGVVERMEPREAGARRVIGRFPAMMKLLALTTNGEVGQRSVRLATELPERAAPNLALAARLTWMEAERTNFSKSPKPAPVDSFPAGVTDRLQAVIEIDFRRTPLEEALLYISEGIDVPFQIDGDALKTAGYTKNMEQNLALGNVPAAQALREILGQYEQMVLIADDKNGTAIVTTLAAAKEKGLEPYSLVP